MIPNWKQKIQKEQIDKTQNRIVIWIIVLSGTYFAYQIIRALWN